MRDISKDLLAIMEKYKCDAYTALLILIHSGKV